MGENSNISIIANKISHEIFTAFHWQLHAMHDTNFDCVLDHHKTEGGKDKLTHPEDVIFHYVDPYLDRRVYLHTDLKSYSKASIQQKKIREALNSLALTVECAQVSPSWKEKYVLNTNERYEVRGLLFVANHDNAAPTRFNEYLKTISKTNIPVAKDQVLHVLGPEKITDLFAVATDIRLEVAAKCIGPAYRFFYPDVTLWKRLLTDDMRVGATIETLMSPYFILRHDGVREGKKELAKRGCVVYYARNGETAEEFVYLLDSLLRYALVNSKEEVRIRVFSKNASPNLHSNFAKAKNRYCSDWGLQEDRAQEIQSISLETVSRLSANYSGDDIGWREKR